MTPAPLRYRLRLLWFYWRRVVSYGFVISLIGGIALAAVNVATADVGAMSWGEIIDASIVGLTVVPIIFVVVGHWPGVILHRVFHGGELPLFQNGGWSPVRLAVASWPFTLVAGSLLAALILLVR